MRATILLIIAGWTSSFAQEVRLDGLLSQVEFEGAKRMQLSGGGELFITRNANELIVALTGSENGWAHVYLVHNDTVHVFHASAALGEQTYVKREGKWSPVSNFPYTMRERTYDGAAIARQDAFLKQRGWVANNNNMGNGKTLEYRLDLKRWSDPSLRLAFAFLSNAREPHFFPKSLSDDTLNEKLLFGNSPDQLVFKFDEWYQEKK